jgi:hypothetical protein
MAVILPHSSATRILDALGLDGVTSFDLSMRMNDVVRIVTHQLATDEQFNRLADEVEQKEWVLLTKEQYEELWSKAQGSEAQS